MPTDPPQPPDQPHNGSDGKPHKPTGPNGTNGDSHRGAKSGGERRQKLFSDYSRYSSVGIQFGVYLLFFIFGGYWLDQKLGTSPWLLISGVLVGFSSGLYSLMKRFPISKRRKATPPDPPKAP